MPREAMPQAAHPSVGPSAWRARPVPPQTFAHADVRTSLAVSWAASFCRGGTLQKSTEELQATAATPKLPRVPIELGLRQQEKGKAFD